MEGVKRIEVGPHLSHAVIHGSTVYLSGVVSIGQSIREQTRNVLEGIDLLLGRAGTDKSKLLAATFLFTDIRNLEEVDSVWETWVSAGNAPARACVEVKLSMLDFHVAIAVIAAR